MKKQAFNPFMPLWEYVPDGEPHVFGDRIYLFGSHDTEGGTRYCSEGNYVGWSAPVDNLGDWQYEGVIFEAKQDPRVSGNLCDLYAPDVVQGNDGRYYMYYGISGGIGADDEHNMALGVAVCDTPTGRYEYYGFVRNADGTPFLRYLPADPGVINDDGVIRMYYGWALSMVAAAAHTGSEDGSEGQPGAGAPKRGQHSMPDFSSMTPEAIRTSLLGMEQRLFHRTKEQLMAEPEDVMGANHVVLGDDMLTVVSEPTRIVPGQFLAANTSFAGHAFYEASSMRKIGQTYYFIYSDENSNMLCYATSHYPDRDFVWRGILHSNGDVGMEGRQGKDRVNMTGNNHGSLVCVNGQWYVFYHRQTHNSTYSRQACAEPVTIAADGSIAQVECTSCGLNGGPLLAAGEYPAPIACQITNGRMPHATNRVVNADIPHVTHDGEERLIGNIKDGTRVGFKYFRIDEPTTFCITTRGDGNGSFEVVAGEVPLGKIEVSASANWDVNGLSIPTCGDVALYLIYRGTGAVEMLNIGFGQM